MDEVTLAARKHVEPGEELTTDYALFELDIGSVCGFECRCGSGVCRRTITGRDWQLPELQTRYAGHWHPTLTQRIAEAGA